jgi:hypothetical protein
MDGSSGYLRCVPPTTSTSAVPGPTRPLWHPLADGPLPSRRRGMGCETGSTWCHWRRKDGVVRGTVIIRHPRSPSPWRGCPPGSRAEAMARRLARRENRGRQMGAEARYPPRYPRQVKLAYFPGSAEVCRGFDPLHPLFLIGPAPGDAGLGVFASSPGRIHDLAQRRDAVGACGAKFAEFN